MTLKERVEKMEGAVTRSEAAIAQLANLEGRLAAIPTGRYPELDEIRNSHAATIGASEYRPFSLPERRAAAWDC